MGLVDAAVLIGMLVVGVPAAIVVGALLARLFRAAWLRAVPFLVVLGAVVFGVPLALRVAGVQTEGRVVAREERVDISWRTSGWSSDQWVTVRYRPLDIGRADPTTPGRAGDSLTAHLRISAAAFDHTPVGATVPVTYVAFRPNLAKITDRTLGDVWRETLATGGAPVELTALIVLVLTAVVASQRPTGAGGRGVRRAVLTVLAVSVFVVGLQIARTSPAHGSDLPMPAPAMARVASVAVFRRPNYSRHDERLPQPYQVAELAFTPAGTRWPVRTADAVDSGSVPGLIEGALLPVHYAPDQPRAAHLDGAARTFERANGRTRTFWWLACSAVLLAGSLALRQGKRRGAGGVRPASIARTASSATE